MRLNCRKRANKYLVVAQLRLYLELYWWRNSSRAATKRSGDGSYRVVQEALTNVIRHAETTNVSVVLNQRPNLITVVVEDDSKGFDTMSGSLRLGILGMHERMALIGGELQTKSSLANGTTIYPYAPVTAV